MTLSDAQIQSLVHAAIDARTHAHAPFSGFKVGAALLAENGTIIPGCNVEISSYSLTSCAERTALFSAVAGGHAQFAAIAVVTNGEKTPPCGACRQALSDFAPDMIVILASLDGTWRAIPLSKLLPEAFGPSHLF